MDFYGFWKEMRDSYLFQVLYQGVNGFLSVVLLVFEGSDAGFFVKLLFLGGN